MKVELLRLKRIGINKKGIFSYYYYRLPDMSYGGFLIFQGRLPKYYIDVFDERYKEMMAYQKKLETNVDGMLSQILKLSSSLDLGTKPDTWMNLGFGKEEFFTYEIEEFPIRIWDEVKNKL